MILKHIICEVAEKHTTAFSTAQENWEELKNLNGFLGQIGGWNINEPTRAHIWAFWEDERQYKRFMSEDHDKFVAAHEQKEYYTKIEVSISEILSSKTNILNFIKKSEEKRYVHFLSFKKDEHSIKISSNEQIDLVTGQKGPIADNIHLTMGLMEAKHLHALAILSLTDFAQTSIELQNYFLKEDIPLSFSPHVLESFQVELEQNWKLNTP